MALSQAVQGRIRRLGAAFVTAAAFTVGAPGAQAAENCTPNASLPDVEKRLPEIYRDLQIMRQLPLTAQDIYDKLKDPAMGVQSCSAPPGSGGSYSNRRAIVSRDTGTHVTIHEYFHWMQDRNGSLADAYRLTMKDAAVAHLLMEAAAASYELVAEQEAKNRGIAFHRHPGLGYFSDNAKVRDSFRKAHDAAFAGNAWRQTPLRETAALEAGGKAAVRAFLEGAEISWTKHYRQKAVSAVNINADVLTRNAEAAYESRRREVFNGLGAATWNISLTPDELLGPSAAIYVDTYFSRAQMRVLEEQTPKLGLWSMP